MPASRSRLDAALTRPAVLALLWAAVVAVVAVLVPRYWIPLDDGTLAQSAERVLGGQLPHRDFGDPYTGLNAVVGALAFKLFGVRLVSLRIPLVAAFAAWLPAVWLLARRYATPGGALWVSLLAAVGSVLAYPAAMPTWFALFTVTWGLWFLLRGTEGPPVRPLLVAAGAAAGVAILFKVVGLYLLAAALLTLAWRRSDGSRVASVVLVTGTGAFLVALVRLLIPLATPAGLYTFFLPAAALSVSLVLRGLTRPPSATTGLERLLRDGTLLLGGLVLPLALFLVPYALSGSVPAWVDGVFLAPGSRFQSAASPPGSSWTVLPGILAVAVAVLATRLSSRGERWLALALAAVLAAALALDDRLSGGVMAVLWYGARGWLPALVLVGAWALGRTRSDEHDGLFPVLATAALWGLVQYPYSAPAYFFYVAPLVVLATAAAAKEGVLRRGPVLALFASVYLFLAAGYVTGVAVSGTEELSLDRGGVRVRPSDATLYRDLTDEVVRHEGRGGLWAGPDAPEVYFLAGAPNPTPTLYEFLDPTPLTADRMETLIRDRHIQVVVVNTRPLFSQPLDEPTLEFLLRRFPEGRSLGPFMVRWESR